MKKRDWIFVLGSVLFLATFLFLNRFIKNKYIKNNYSVTCGVVTYYSNTTKGTTIIEYKYIINKIEYKHIGGNVYFKDCKETKWCIGKCYEVEYSSKNPNNSRMNFDKPCDCDSFIIKQGVVITADKE